jgi:hypothetical protein
MLPELPFAMSLPNGRASTRWSGADERSAWGSTSVRSGMHGRLDEMLIIKGVNIFSSDVEALVRGDQARRGSIAWWWTGSITSTG